MEITLLAIGLAIIITGVIRNELAIIRIERNQKAILSKLRGTRIDIMNNSIELNRIEGQVWHLVNGLTKENK